MFNISFSLVFRKWQLCISFLLIVLQNNLFVSWTFGLFRRKDNKNQNDRKIYFSYGIYNDESLTRSCFNVIPWCDSLKSVEKLLTCFWASHITPWRYSSTVSHILRDPIVAFFFSRIRSRIPHARLCNDNVNLRR